MTLRELFNAIKGRQEREVQKRDDEWALIRLQTCALLMPHLKKGKKLKPKQLWKLPSEAIDLNVKKLKYMGPSPAAKRWFKKMDEIHIKEWDIKEKRKKKKKK